MSHKIRRLVLQRLARLFDLGAVGLAFVAGLAIASGAFTWPDLASVLAMRIALVNLILFAIYFVLCTGIFSACGLYRSHRLSSWKLRVREVLLAVTITTGIIIVARELIELKFATNEFLVFFWLFLLVTLVLTHEMAQRLLYYARSHGRNIRTIVIVGEWGEARDIAERLEKDSNFGYRVLDIIDPGGSQI
jgi:FlaA1/EpsC-like NDP-sugar epimerase